MWNKLWTRLRPYRKIIVGGAGYSIAFGLAAYRQLDPDTIPQLAEVIIGAITTVAMYVTPEEPPAPAG